MEDAIDPTVNTDFMMSPKYVEAIIICHIAKEFFWNVLLGKA